MPKIILFKELGRYCITSEENYNAYVRDASAVSKFPPDSVKSEVIDTLVRWGVTEREDLIDKTGE